VKAILYYLNQRPWGHSILKLLEAYENLGKTVPNQIKKAANTLDPHYINSRYPDIMPDYSPKEFYNSKIARELQNAAQAILNFIEEEKESVK